MLAAATQDENLPVGSKAIADQSRQRRNNSHPRPGILTPSGADMLKQKRLRKHTVRRFGGEEKVRVEVTGLGVRALLGEGSPASRERASAAQPRGSRGATCHLAASTADSEREKESNPNGWGKETVRQ